MEGAEGRIKQARKLNDNFLFHACGCKVFVKTRVVLQSIEGDGNERFCHRKDLTVSTERLGQDSEEKRKKPNLQISFCHLCQSMGKVQTRFEACDPQNHSDVSSTRQH